MESNTLTLLIINIAQMVIFIILTLSWIGYLKKNTMSYLIGYSVSSLIICALSIIGLLIAKSSDKSYEMYIMNIIIYALNFLISIFIMGNRFGNKSNLNTTVGVVGTDENNVIVFPNKK